MRTATVVAGLLVAAAGACSSGGSEPAATGSTQVSNAVEEWDRAAAAMAHGEAIVELVELVPPATQSVTVVDIASLSAALAPEERQAVFSGVGLDPALTPAFTELVRLAGPLDVATTMSSVLLGQTDDPSAGGFLLAKIDPSIGENLSGEAAGPPDDADLQRVVTDDGVLVGGPASLVESIVGGVDEGASGELSAFLTTLDANAHLSFVVGLPALSGGAEPDLTLRSAAVVSGAIEVTDGMIGGSVVAHTPNADQFVTTYHRLDLAATEGGHPLASKLTVADPIVGELGQVVVALPPRPLRPTADEMREGRALFRKLFVGMEAFDYAAQVADRTEPAWLDLVVKSEADADSPPSPGSVFLRWEFRDDAAREAFERDELPEGFRLAPIQFLEADDSDGEYFLVLNLYNAGGGSIVGGARAEWDVFVDPPAGADPGAGDRPRFFVVEALAEQVSADPGNLLTPAEPVSHRLVDGMVISSVARYEGDEVVPVFSSTFPVPDPSSAEVARFTREMAIGNDHIYWAHGVADRGLYNATTFNHDAYRIDGDQVTIDDDSRWAKYVRPAAKDAIYYVNTLEYVASPMANLDSEHLDISSEWLAELVAFTTNGHQSSLMRSAVERSFRGAADPLVGVHLPNTTPATFFHFEITDPDGLAAALGLPPGHRLAPITLFEGEPERHYLTLSMVEFDEAMEGTRAEWGVYVDDGRGRPPHLMVVELMTEEVAFDPDHIIHLPSGIDHSIEDGVVATRLSSATVSFDASFDLSAATRRQLSLDWIEAGDMICRPSAICDRYYYDAETLDVPVLVPSNIELAQFSTPWDDFVSASPPTAFARDHAQEYAVKRWYNVDVPVDELPFSGLDGATHEISGTGTLVGRTTSVADSDYSYTGDAIVEGDQLTFALDQQVSNALGVGHIFTTGTFDLNTGTGTQTVADCQGPSLLCSGIEIGATSLYATDRLDTTDRSSITWGVDAVVDIGGSFGLADSTSTFTATGAG